MIGGEAPHFCNRLALPGLPHSRPFARPQKLVRASLSHPKSPKANRGTCLLSLRLTRKRLKSRSDSLFPILVHSRRAHAVGPHQEKGLKLIFPYLCHALCRITKKPMAGDRCSFGPSASLVGTYVCSTISIACLLIKQGEEPHS